MTTIENSQVEEPTKEYNPYRIIGYIFAFFTFVIFVMLSIVFFMHVKYKALSFSSKVYTIASSSMSPTLEVGDVVFVTKQKEYYPLDIIAFRGTGYADKDIIVTHRIVSINGDKIVAKGDNNIVSDDIIDKSQVIGKVVNILPHGQYTLISNLFTCGYLFLNIFIVLVIIDVIILFFIKARDKKIKKNNAGI